MRYIKPQFFLNEDLGTIHKLARYLYIGLWCLSDDRGVFEWKPARIRIQIFPYDTDISTENINDWLKSLIELGDIVQFTEHGNDYGYCVNFSKHQLINNPSKWTFTEKLPDGYDDTPILPESYHSPMTALPLGSRDIGSREKGVGKKEESELSPNKKSYGEFNNVLLTDDQYEKLVTKFGKVPADEKIAIASEKFKAHGYHYKDHYAVILGWARTDKAQGKTNVGNPAVSGKKYIEEK
jgi:hypothetical protein